MDYIEEKKRLYELELEPAPPIMISKANFIKEKQRLEELKTAEFLEEQFSSVTKKQTTFSSGVQNILRTSKDLLLPVLALSAGVFGVKKVVDELTKFRIKYSPLKTESGEYLAQPDTSEPNITEAKYQGKDKKSVIKNKIIDEANKQGIDPALALALADQESAFNPKAKSKTGARGIYQMTSPACKQVGIPFDEKLYDADYNIKYGLKYLKWCLNNTSTVEEALFAWNSGIGNLRTAKKRGDDLGTWNSANRVSKGKGFTTQTMPKIDKYRKELSNLYQKTQQQMEKTTSSSAGKFTKVKDNTKFGTYTINNPNKSRGYVELSERAQAYLKDVGGTGVITSGAEGTHAKGTVSHGAGNKIDVVTYNYHSNQEWAKVAIPFLKNKNTAFVCFEGFEKSVFSEIEKIIYSQISEELKKKCKSKCKYGWGARGGTFLDYANDKKSMANGRHLDIGILPNAYSFVNQYKETNPSEAKAQKGNESKKPVQDNINKQTELNKSSTNKPKQVATNTTNQTKKIALVAQQKPQSGPELIDVQSANT